MFNKILIANRGDNVFAEHIATNCLACAACASDLAVLSV